MERLSTRRLALLACAVLELVGQASAEAQCPNVSCTGPSSGREFVAAYADPQVYDKTKRPPCGAGTSGEATVVEVQLYLTQVNAVNLKLQQVEVVGYFRTWWKDSRLAFPNKTQGGCFDAFNLNGAELDSMWVPDLYIDNMVTVEFNQHATLMQVSSDGSVWRSQQIEVKVKSPIDLGKLPYDQNRASIVLASYSQDIERMRVMARGGSVGGGVSGVGIVAPPMQDQVWDFGSGSAADGFETPGRVEVSGSWDYLTLEFTYSRHPKYFTDQVILPCLLFLCVSYIQFFVDPAAAPARAALAVIPVLIMRTVGNSVYRTLPEGSQRMWLADFVVVSMFISVAAACEYGIVQYFLTQEKAQARNMAELQKVKPMAERVCKLCQQEGITLITYMEQAALRLDAQAAPLTGTRSKSMCWVEHLVGGVSIDNGSERVVPTPPAASDESSARARAADDDTKQADLVFIKYTWQIFSRFDADASGTVSASEIRRVLNFFNIYLSTAQVAEVIGMFLRDQGETSSSSSGPDSDSESVSFSMFTAMIFQVERYLLGVRHERSLLGKLQGMPRSHRCDVLFRVAFPFTIILQVVVFYAALPLY